jgi:murein DD-endopeptidase MepM/ murein hydrolase activator NlpD
VSTIEEFRRSERSSRDVVAGHTSDCVLLRAGSVAIEHVVRVLRSEWHELRRELRTTSGATTRPCTQLVTAFVCGSVTLRMALASVLALTLTMCSYWAQSSVMPARPELASSDAPRPGEPQAFVDPQQTTAKTDRLDAFIREARAADQSASPTATTAVDWPGATRRVVTTVGTGPKGERKYGIRIMVDVGTPIRAAAAGVVTFAGNAGDGYGNKVVVRHGAVQTIYAHADELMVRKSDRIRRGQVVAKSGQSGFASAPQLYLGIVSADPAIDPIAFFEAGSTPDDRTKAAAAGARDRRTAQQTQAPWKSLFDMIGLTTPTKTSSSARPTDGLSATR